MRCGTVSSAAGAEELAKTLDAISTFVCGDYDADGCGRVLIPPYTAPSALDCIDGQCVEAQE